MAVERIRSQLWQVLEQLNFEQQKQVLNFFVSLRQLSSSIHVETLHATSLHFKDNFS